MLFFRFHRRALLLCAGLLIPGLVSADQVIYRGKVTLEDGSPPGRLVTVQRVCDGLDHAIREGTASAKTGEYFVRLEINYFGGSFSSSDSLSLLPCHLEASATGFASTWLDLTDYKMTSNPRLPPIILTPATKGNALGVNLDVGVPHAASRSWDSSIKQITARDWAAAEDSLRAVTRAAPKFAPAWAMLGTVCANLARPEDSRQALQRAIELDPKPLGPYMMLAHTLIDLKDWQGASATAKKLMASDTKHVFVEANLVNAVALYQLHDLDGSFAQINEAIRLDKQHELTRAEYVLGVILEARHEYAAAGEHLRNYVQQHPRAKDVATVTDRIANLGKAPIADLSLEFTALDLRPAVAGEAPVPGGIKAFSAVAQLKGTPSYQDFFLEYCRAVTEGGPAGINPTKEAGDAVRAYITSVAALEALGERRDNSTLIHLSMNNAEQIHKSQVILAELGWKLVPKGDSFSVEPGDRPNDGFRQWALAALGVDELALRQAIGAKQNFDFEIPKENARLVGGAAWGVILKGVPDLAGGPAEIFMKDWRFARVYSGLGAMEGDSAAAVVSAIGLSNLLVKYSALIADYGEVLALADKQVAVPGGLKAHAAWAKVAGTSPQNPVAFLRALFEKDQGRLLAFYFDLARADAAHQQYFTMTPDRAEAFYKWYRDSAGPSGLPKTPDRWQASILQTLRIDASGKLQFPGGREAWATGSESDDEVLLHHAPLEALGAIAVLEEKRGVPLSAAAVQLLAQHYNQWRTLFGYFEKLPGLDAAEFRALADFADTAAKAPAGNQNLLLGEWHSLVKLIVLGTQAGSLNASQGAQAFRQVCEAMRSPNPSAGAIEAVREMGGGATDVDEALASHLLRLNGARREAFEHVKTLQNVPRIGSLTEPPDAAKTLAALSGAVYAAVLDPAYLLVAEDPQLLSRHNFLPLPGESEPGLFASSSIMISNGPPGTNFVGGFGSFHEAARALHGRTVGQLQPEPAANAVAPQAAAPQAEAAPAEWPERPEGTSRPSNDLVFRAGGRIVEVYATVTDSRGRYVDDLTPAQFTILEEGRPKPAFAFENHTAGVSVALVFDTTGSMVTALPPLKNAAMQLVDELRPTDSVAVYSFNDTVTELEPFTSDKVAAKRAILKTHAAGVTALYDALVRVNHDLSARTGKKVIIVFTDGNDNSSMLPASVAIERAKARGIPIYTIAEGEALSHPQLIADLANISQSTGGTPFLIRKMSDISAVFEKMSQDLMHGYLVAFQPAPGDNRVWRKLEVVLSGRKGLVVRAREGFYIE